MAFLVQHRLGCWEVQAEAWRNGIPESSCWGTAGKKGTQLCDDCKLESARWNCCKNRQVSCDAKESFCFLSELASLGLMIVSGFSTSGQGGGDGAALQNCHVCSCASWWECSTCGTFVKAMSLISSETCPAWTYLLCPLVTYSVFSHQVFTFRKVPLRSKLSLPSWNFVSCAWRKVYTD